MKHSRILLSTEVISRVIKAIEVIKKTLFVYKIQIFNSMWKKYSVDFKDLSPEIKDELILEKAEILPLTVLNKLLVQDNDPKKDEKEENPDQKKNTQLKINMKCHSISLLLQFSDGTGKGKVASGNEDILGYRHI